ncbi:MAG: MFS transporter [Chloroflexi bacterium]|nr:MFS transporter [Chloroflexota bacterium]
MTVRRESHPGVGAAASGGKIDREWERPGHGSLVLNRRMFASLAHRDFRYLWTGNLAAMFAMQMQMVARGWLIFAMTGSAIALAWTLVSFMAPMFVFSLVGGVVADRLKKKWVMVAGQGLNIVATLILATIIITGNVTLTHFILFGIFNGAILAFSMPARQAIIPEIVGEKALFNAMALSTASMNLSRILAPAMAGVLIALIAGGDNTSTLGVGIVFYIIAACYAVSVVTLAALRHEGGSVMTERRSLGGDMMEGIRYMRRSPVIMGLLVMTFIPIIFGMPVQLLLPVFNEEILQGGAAGLGLLYGGMGIGALVGSLVLAAMGDVRHKGYFLIGACLVWAVFMAIFALSTAMWAALLLLAFVGLASTAFMALNWTIMQLVVKPEMRGRVMSILMMSFGLMPLGVIPMGFLTEALGIDIALLIGAIGLGVLTLVAAIAIPAIRRIDTGYETLEQSEEPTPQPQVVVAEAQVAVAEATVVGDE